MALYQRIIMGGSVLAALSGFLGCEKKVDQGYQTKEFAEPSHFATVPMVYNTGLAMTSGDFDGDGDLDLIVGATKISGADEGRLYQFNNDGKGNFSQ